jgi:hypothetical protein
MRTVKLPSGAELKIGLAPFSESNALFKAVGAELKSLKVTFDTELDVNLLKDIVCSAVASDKIEGCIWDCMKKCVYNDSRITKETFEPEEARQDYYVALLEVAKENLIPFTKSLSAQFADILKKINPAQA